jgi:predicted Rossmann fold nucleotide-binding protein DprA/Smf involved in DNA uptake
MNHAREQAAVLALAAKTKGEWYKTAALIEEAGSALQIVEGQTGVIDWLDRSTVEALGSQVTEDVVDTYAERTIAVFGTGINRIYPPEHEDLAQRILDNGAHVSQFWPDAPPAKFTFPMRNVVTSGMALGTVVVEAHGRSGAWMQARICLEHGKRLFLVRSLVLHEPWARKYAEHPATTVIDSVEEVVEAAATLATPPPAQLTLG